MNGSINRTVDQSVKDNFLTGLSRENVNEEVTWQGKCQSQYYSVMLGV